MSKKNIDNTHPCSNGWSINKKLVLHRLEESEHDARNMRKRIEKLERQVAVYTAQTRMVAAGIGAIAGLVPAVITILFDRM